MPRIDTLLPQIAAGDQLAFAELYDAVAPRVYGLALRILRDPHQSEEVAQEVLLEVWQIAQVYDVERGSVVSWVMMLTHRRAVDRVRSSESSRRRDLAHGERTVDTPLDQTSDAAHAALEADDVRSALAQLPVAQRRVLELAYFEGCTHTEISQRLQIPLGTAKTRIRDGLRRLRDQFAGQQVLTPA